MVPDEFYEELEVIRLENSVLLAATHFNDLGYVYLHDLIWNKVRQIVSQNLSLEQKRNKLNDLSDHILETSPKGDDANFENIKMLLILRNEFKLNHYEYLNNGFFKNIGLSDAVKRDHRICRIGDYGTIQEFHRTGILSRRH